MNRDILRVRPSEIVRWWVFTQERFEPISHFVMILFFVAAHWVAVSKTERLDVSVFRVLPILVGSIAFFFKLRLFDEIKDYEHDIRFNPSRPLARGLLQVPEVKFAIIFCIFLELICFGSYGLVPLATISFSILYSILMYHEFFIGTWLRPRLTLYAVTHTLVSVFLSSSILTALTARSTLSHAPETLKLCASSWFLFNVFEFGRKTFATIEERSDVPSYSKIFTPNGAVVLVLSQTLIASWLLAWNNAITAYLLLTGITLAALGATYAAQNRKETAKFFRMASSAYIVLVYLGIITCLSGYLSGGLNVSQ